MSDIKIGKMTLGMCQTNCYFIFREGEENCIVVDPADRGAFLVEKLKENGHTVEAILLTHGHFDHLLGAEKMRELTCAKVYALAEEEPLLLNAGENLSGAWAEPVTLKADEFLKDGQEVTIGGKTFKVLHTPGHTKGGCGFYFEEAGILISGDSLFQESIGRTDFPGGSMSELVRSVKEKFLTLPEDTRVFPGHGGSTTVGYEKINNCFLQ